MEHSVKAPIKSWQKSGKGMINKSNWGYHKYRGDVNESEKSCLQQTAEEMSTSAPPQPPRRPPRTTYQ